ncbi:MAG: methionyl-tRNA formyltransferase [Desulfovibrionaceae bacterium]
MPRIVFAGGSTPVQKVLEAVGGLPGLELVALFTEPGASPEIEAQARDMGLALYDETRLATAEGVALLRGLRPDWLCSVNTTMLFSKKVLAAPRCGALNMHPGRLPDYAGLHTHQWAIRNGETSFAATVHWMEAKVDAGDVALQDHFPITPKDTGLSLFVKCLHCGAALMARALAAIAAGEALPRIPQDVSRRRLYTHAQALDGTIHWTWTARQIADFVRAADYAPFACPTYAPETTGPLGRIVVRKAVVPEGAADAAAGTAGEVLAVDEAGVTVAAGQGAVRIVRAQAGDGPVVKGAALAEALGVRPGAVLGGAR